ncbi:hypothetical protein T265_12952, partial [Opisthorchis viverrini]
MPSVTKVKSCGRKKIYWLEATGELVCRERLPKSVAFDHNQAYELLPRSKTLKPMMRCKVRCIADGIKVKKASTFGAQPPRKFYPYKDIQRFYSFKDFPNFLILGCPDSETRNRYYEIFKFDEGQVQELCEIIDRAHAHPLCLLVDDDSSLVRYQSSQSSLASDTEKRPELATPQQAMPTVTSSPGTEDDRGLSEEVLMEEEPLLEAAANDVSEFQMTMSPADELTVEAVENVKMEINQEVSMATPGEAETNAEVHHRSPIPKHLRSDPLFESLCQNVKEEDLWAVDMKYVDNHPQYGNQIVPNGAVYLFVAHHKYPELLIQPTGNMLNNHVPSDEDDGLNTAELEFTTKFLKRPTASG